MEPNTDFHAATFPLGPDGLLEQNPKTQTLAIQLLLIASYTILRQGLLTLFPCCKRKRFCDFSHLDTSKEAEYNEASCSKTVGANLFGNML